MQLTIGEFFIYLIQKKGFYGRLASSLHRIPRKGMGTMAVGIRDGRAVLYYDPEFVAQLDLSTALFVLEHEMLHLILDHIPRYLELLSIQPTELDKRKAAAVYNIAMDCAINTMLRQHEGFESVQKLLLDRIAAKYPDEPQDPKNGLCLPEKFNLPLEGTFEMYQYMLMRQVEIHEIVLRLHGGTTHSMWGDPGEGEGDKEGEGQGAGKGQGAGQGTKEGGAGGGGNGDKMKREIIDITFDGSAIEGMTADELMSQAHRVREQVKNALRQVAKSLGGIGRGLLPAGVEEWLEAYLADPIIPWWEIFSTRARASRPAKQQRSCTQPNRSLMALAEEEPRIIPMPGRVRDRVWNIFLMVDTSGSMSTESLEIAKSELQHMLNVEDGTEIRYMEGDAAVHTDIVLKKGDEIPKEVVGRGGTDFDAYFIHMKQYLDDSTKSPDLVIVYTDGFAPAIKEANRFPPEIPVIWLVTPQHSEDFENYGEVIVCDPEHNARRKKAA